MRIFQIILNFFISEKQNGEVTPEQHQQDLKRKMKLESRGYKIIATDKEFKVSYKGLTIADCLVADSGGTLASHRTNLRTAIDVATSHRRK